MDNPESFASFNKTSVTRSSELLKDSVWSSGNGHTLIYETNEHIPTQGLMRYIYLASILQGGSIEKQCFVHIVKPISSTVSSEHEIKNIIGKINKYTYCFIINIIKLILNMLKIKSTMFIRGPRRFIIILTRGLGLYEILSEYFRRIIYN